MTEIGTLNEAEPHPAAFDAKDWIKEHLASGPVRACRLLDAFSSVGMSGNRLAEVCGETLRRLLNAEPVSDRYLLGLAWTLKTMDEDDNAADDEEPEFCHEWKHTPEVRTTPLKCLLCDDQAVVIVHAPDGCTCSPNRYQPRCDHHLRRAWDSDEDITVVEDFRIPTCRPTDEVTNG